MQKSSLVTLVVAAALSLACCAEVVAQGRGGFGRKDKAPEVGETAPLFRLHRLGPDGKASGERVALKSFRGKQPVVLIFGSYT